jgi:hypothetical protein
MATPEKRMGFAEAWLDDLRDDVRLYGARALVPWKIILCGVVAYAASSLLGRDSFWDKPEISAMFFSAVVTINGLLLALSWGSFGKIYEIASTQPLAGFLKKHKKLNMYIFIVDYIHYAQVIALFWSGVALFFSIVSEIPYELEGVIALQTIQRFSFIFSVASSIYALIYALGAVRLMQDLLWYSSELDNISKDVNFTVHPGGRNVE